MRQSTIVAIVTIGLAILEFSGASIGQPATEKALQLETKIPLGSVAGRIDHMAIDLERHRLFVAELATTASELLISMRRRSFIASRA